MAISTFWGLMPIPTTRCIIPEMISLDCRLTFYSQAAALLSEVLGRKITHKRITFDEAVEMWSSFGLPKGYVVELTTMEEQSALHGTEEAALKEPNVVRGKKSLKEYFVENRARWIPQ